MILILHGTNNLSLQRKLFLTYPLQKLLLLNYILIHCLDLFFSLILLGGEVKFMFDYHLIFSCIIFLYDLFDLLLVLMVLLHVLLQDFTVCEL